MYYSEYAIAARTHFQSCKFMYDNCLEDSQIKMGGSKDILYRLLYLCGHVIECAAVYLIYNHFNWCDNKDIPRWNGSTRHINLGYNRRFTLQSHIDFYPLSVDKSSGRITSTSKWRGKFYLGSAQSGEEFFNIQGHRFKDYIQKVIWPQLPQDVPYFRQPCPEDREYQDAINLIDTWNTDLRYYYEGRQSGHYIGNNNSNETLPTVNAQTIGELLKMCEKIVGLMPSGRQL